MQKPVHLFVLVIPLLMAGVNRCEAAEPTVDGLLTEMTRAYGGIEALEDIRSVEFEYAGYRISRHQSRRTAPPYDRVPVRSFVAIDLENQWVVRDAVGSYPGGLDFLSRSIIGPDGSFGLDTEQRTWSRGGMMGYDGLKASAVLQLTPLLVRRMNREKGSLRLKGRKWHHGTPYHHLQLGETGILVHPESSLVFATIGEMYDMAQMKQLELWRIYPEHRIVDGILWPAALLNYLPEPDEFITDYRLVRLRTNIDVIPYLEVPEGFVEGANPHMGYANDGALKARPVGEGVWLAGDHNTNVLYVEFDDHFVAMEIGGMAWYAEDVYQAMKPLMNEKPLRLVIPTHYHDDHAVGLRFYVTLGATVLTTPEKTGWLRELLQPLDDGKWVDRLQFEFLDGRRHVIRDETNELQVLNYRNAPHSENMLVGYLPDQKAVFSADLFIGWGNTSEVRQGAGYGLRHFVNWLDATLGDEAQSLEAFLPVHGRPYSRSEIQSMLDRPRTFIKLPGNTVHGADDWFTDYGLFDETVGGRRDFFIP